MIHSKPDRNQSKLTVCGGLIETIRKSLTKIYYFTNKYHRISDLGLTFPHFEFSSLYLDMFDQNLHFCAKSFNFDQTYLNTGSKTQNVENLSLDLIFYDICWQNSKSFSNITPSKYFTLNWTEINQN